MQGIMKFTFLGMDEFVGKKDPTKKYYNVSLLQNSEIAKVFLDQGQEVLFKDLDKFDELECTVMFKLGQDRYGAKIDYRLIDFKLLLPEIPFEDTENVGNVGTAETQPDQPDQSEKSDKAEKPDKKPLKEAV